MPQVFPRSSNALSRISLLGAAVFAGLLATIAFFLVRSPYASGVNQAYDQPVQFSHKHHSGGDGIDCRYCHTSVETSSYAGIPPTETCMNCHKELWANSPNLQPVRDSWESGEPIHWNKVHDLPDFVYFNHSIHIAKGMGCSTCHGGVTQMNLTWKAEPMNMTWCLNCHSEPEKYIRPKSEIYNADYKYPPDQQELGKRLVKEYDVRSREKLSCSVCHR